MLRCLRASWAPRRAESVAGDQEHGAESAAARARLRVDPGAKGAARAWHHGHRQGTGPLPEAMSCRPMPRRYGYRQVTQGSAALVAPDPRRFIQISAAGCARLDLPWGRARYTRSAGSVGRGHPADRGRAAARSSIVAPSVQTRWRTPGRRAGCRGEDGPHGGGLSLGHATGGPGSSEYRQRRQADHPGPPHDVAPLHSRRRFPGNPLAQDHGAALGGGSVAPRAPLLAGPPMDAHAQQDATP